MFQNSEQQKYYQGFQLLCLMKRLLSNIWRRGRGTSQIYQQKNIFFPTRSGFKPKIAFKQIIFLFLFCACFPKCKIKKSRKKEQKFQNSEMMEMLLEFLAGILVKMLLGIEYGDEGGKTSQSNLLFLSSKSFIFNFYSISL